MTKPALSTPTKPRGKKSDGAAHESGDPVPGNHFFAEQESCS